MLIILATQEAKVGRSLTANSLRLFWTQQDPLPKKKRKRKEEKAEKKEKQSMVVHIYKPSTQEAKAGGPQIPGQTQL